jgi:hypothetical protein
MENTTCIFSNTAVRISNLILPHLTVNATFRPCCLSTYKRYANCLVTEIIECKKGTGKRKVQPRTGLINLWHAFPNWHAERFPWHAENTAVPNFFLFLLANQSLYCQQYIYIYSIYSNRSLFLTLSNLIFLPTAYSPALICFGRERVWWITCNYPTVLKEKNMKHGDTERVQPALSVG